jgi:predicted DNA-binding protein (MmcQ/YjbR family)
MNVDEIRHYCLSFPETTEKLQWSDALCFKVNAKMFAVLGLDEVRFTFKCTPEVFAELVEREDIRPAPYVGRYKWVMLDRLDALKRSELEDLVRQSYEMVAAKAPKRKSGSKIGTKSSKKRASKKRAPGAVARPKRRKRR